MIEIHDLPDGATIKEPGAYRTPIDHYHTQAICPGPSVSSSDLRAVDLTTPARWWAFSNLNSNRFERDPNDAFDFGKAAHALLLGDEDFEAGYAVRPEEFTSYRTKDAKVWLEATRAFGKTPVTPEDMVHINGMAEALHAHGLPNVVFGGEPEVSLIWRDDTGLWVKARPDALPGTGDLGDLKTCAEATVRATNRAIVNHGYDMQMALCVEGMKRVLGVEPPMTALIFVEKKPPYTVLARTLDKNAIYLAAARNRRALNTIAACIEAGHFPGEGEDGLAAFDTPEWMEKRLLEEQSDGRLPNEGIGV